MTYDFDSILRQVKPEKHRKQLSSAGVEIIGRQGTDSPDAVMLDTVVYIDLAAGRLDAALESALERPLKYHCLVALMELAQGVGACRPDRSDYNAVRRHYADLLRALPRSRLLSPDNDCWIRAGVITGVLTRTQNYQPQEMRALNADALIFLTAAKAGIPIVTRNVRDFGLLRQVHGAGRVIGYDRH